jgi:tetratricopeptide (TPR) repeat protein/O-antigen ligase
MMREYAFRKEASPMQTRLATFCEKVIEAGWLLALVIVPLFFNVYSSRVFEPDKLSLLRSIALIMVVAWLVKQAETRLGKRAASATPDAAPIRWWSTPLVTPTLILALVYVLATITSVVPRISLWGSYQRLQGTYTLFSYLVIFFLMLDGLRREAQLERLWSLVCLTSLPIAFYGLIQHNQMDPLPWGGDVTFRVASNMGNAIFIGAYLIMVIPLTIARVIHFQTTALEGASSRARGLFALGFWAVWALVTFAFATLGLGRGLVAGGLGLVMLALLALYLGRPMGRLILPGVYGLILSVQIVCLIFSQSRGPVLGLLAGLFFFALLYCFARNWRKAILVLIVMAMLGVAFLGVLNLPNTPLAAVREMPYIGRLGHVFETQGGTGRVRVLIWEGAVEMIGSNPARALIGYGPEAMYVAYNPFYPPELAQIEARNASPDRSHNELFDALVITGFVGLFAYMLLFGSALYYGLHCVELIKTRRDTRLFLGLGIGGALLGALLPLLMDGSFRYAGVGVPLGFVAGLALFVTLAALLGRKQDVPSGSDGAPTRLSGWRLLLAVAVVSAVIAHFIEIHLGIAVAASRTYFWAYAALLVLVGQGMIRTADDAAPEAPAPVAVPAQARSGKRKRQASAPTPRPALGRAPSLIWQVVAAGWLTAMLLITMCWDYITNPLAELNPITVLVGSLTTLAARRMPDVISLGMLWLFLSTMVLCGLVLMHELVLHEEKRRDVTWWLSAWGWYLLSALGPTLVFALVHASRIGPRASVAGLLYGYCIALGLVWLALSLLLNRDQPRPRVFSRGALALAYPVLLAVALVLAINLNLSTVRADTFYKQGLRYDQEANWDNAIYLYERAIEAAPQEDFYHLFMGRALMEKAKVTADASLRDAYFGHALGALQEAERLNPLNTDHTANTARLHRTWADLVSDPAERESKLKLALTYYERAIALSPNNAQLRNESGLVHFLLTDFDSALARYNESLVLDDRFAQTYLLIGDVALNRQDWGAAIENYTRVLEVDPRAVQGWSALGYAYSQMEDWERAIAANQAVLELAPGDYSTLKNLAILYNQSEQLPLAIEHAEKALEVAPESEKATIEGFITQLRERQSVGGQ